MINEKFRTLLRFPEFSFLARDGESDVRSISRRKLDPPPPPSISSLSISTRSALGTPLCIISSYWKLTKSFWLSYAFSCQLAWWSDLRVGILKNSNKMTIISMTNNYMTKNSVQRTIFIWVNFLWVKDFHKISHEEEWVHVTTTFILENKNAFVPLAVFAV